MRRLHRWFGLITGIFFAVIALTGICMQTISLLSPREEDRPPAVASNRLNVAPASPAVSKPQPPRKPDLYHWLDHVHDGEFAGPAGRVFSLVLGFALLFFSVSGIWMYWKMFQGRSRNDKTEIFW